MDTRHEYMRRVSNQIILNSHARQGPKLSTRKEKMITGKGRRGPKLFHPVRVRNLGHFQPGPLCGRATDKTLH